jgi:tubulysin polyketide synthase-like protein
VTPLELLRTLVDRRMTLVVIDGRVTIRAPRGTATPDVRRAVSEHRQALVGLLAEAALRSRWQVPADVSIPPRLAGVLGLLQLEFTAFTPDQRDAWLKCLSRRNDVYYADPENGCPPHINRLLAVEDALRERAEVPIPAHEAAA